MAYGKSSGWKKVIYFSTHTKEDEAPHFVVKSKINDQYVDLEDADFVEGFIHSIKFKDEPSFDKKYMEKNLYVNLFDGDELYVVRIKFFMIGRSIMNSLASLVKLDGPLDGKLVIRLYRAKPNEKGERYPRAYVGYGPESLNWTMTAEQMKSLTRKVTINGKDATDSSALDKRLTELMEMAIHHVELHHASPVRSSDPSPAAEIKPDSTNGTQYSDPEDLDQEFQDIADQSEGTLPGEGLVPGDDLPF